MMTSMVSLMIQIVVGIRPVGPDPSLVVDSVEACIAVRDTFPETVLDFDGLLLMWDDQSEEFALWVDEELVSDLGTSRGPGPGGWSFGGTLNGGDVEGAVRPGITQHHYTIDITLPNEQPLRYLVYNPSGTPTVINVQVCECSDGIDLGCKTPDCNAAATCPNSGGSTVCKYMVVYP